MLVMLLLFVLAGGASYPLTGSTGDGYVLRKMGHTCTPITDIRPSLSLSLQTKQVKEIMGLSS